MDPRYFSLYLHTKRRLLLALLPHDDDEDLLLLTLQLWSDFIVVLHRGHDYWGKPLNMNMP